MRINGTRKKKEKIMNKRKRKNAIGKLEEKEKKERHSKSGRGIWQRSNENFSVLNVSAVT